MEKEFQYSLKGKRKMSEFFARGLLYDFIEKNLDSERSKAVSSIIEYDENLKQELNKISVGLEVTKNISQASVSEELLRKVAISSSYFYGIKESLNFDKWSPALKLGIEGSIIALGVAILAIVTPWNTLLDLNIGPDHIVLSEVTKNVETIVDSEIATSQKEGLIYPDDQNLGKSQEPDKAVTTTTLLLSAGITEAKKPTQATLPTSKIDANIDKVSNPTSSEKKAGFLFRGNLYVTNLKAITPKLVEKVQELGGRKAGQVELGWFKGGSSYFHFTIPDSKYHDLETFFNTYGTLNLQREAHERVMPEGIRRVIITVYEKK